MSRRARMLAAALLCAPLIDVPLSPAADVHVTGPTCTVLATTAEREEMLALSGIFAANWSAEILRDIPGSGADMSLARVWHADKTTEELADMPEPVRAAVDRINAAGQRVGYTGEEASAALRVLVDRNERRRDLARREA
ncbi:hypothetical protein, partial [Corynebacterium nasicanis]